MKKNRVPLFIVILLFISVLFVSKFSPYLHAGAPSEKTIPLDPSLQPNDVVIDSVYHHAYIASHTTLMTIPLPITVVDTVNDSVIGVLPASTVRAIAVNSTTHRLFVGDPITNVISVFDTQTNLQVATISSLLTSPIAFAMNESTNRLYTISQTVTGSVQTGILSVLNATSGSIISSTIPVGDNPTALAVNPLTNRIYVISSGVDSHVSVVDGETNAVIATIPFTGSLEDVALDTILNKIYITNDTGTTIFTLNGETSTTLPEIGIPDTIGCAHTLTVDSSAHKLYAACFNGLSIIDTKTNVVVQQLPLTGELPVTHSITAQYMSIDSTLQKVYVPLEETHQMAVVTLLDSPKINSIAPIDGNEGKVISLPFSFIDDNSVSWKVTADFGDKTPLQIQSLTTKTGIFQHVFADNGNYHVTLTVTNTIGATDSLTIPVTVRNVSPTVGMITTKNKIIPVSGVLLVQASFSDPGTYDTHTAIWNWGDGTATDGNITGTNTSGLVVGSHRYIMPGVYTISLSVTDKDGAVTTNTLEYIVVHEGVIRAIFGEGNVASPLGALKANPLLSGRMDIGLYATSLETGASGSAKYHFQLANFDFQSTTMDSIMRNGQRIILAGKGILNNTGDYAFSMIIQDQNTIRLKIWNTASGLIVYDNQMGQPDSVSPSTVLEKGLVMNNL